MASMPPKINSEGKYTLLSATLSAPGGRVLDLQGQFVKCDIYESILSPTVIGVFQLYDSVGVFNSFVFEEQELCLSWTTNEKGKDIHYRFKILGGDPQAETTTQGQTAIYTLTGISAESYNSTKMKDFQEKLPAVTKKIEPYAIVTLILEQALKSEKPKYYEKTKGLHQFSLTKKTPFEAIEIARQEAISSSNQSSSYVFFENKDGYHFITVEELIKRGKKRIGDKVFFNAPVGGLDSGGSLWRNILAYKVIQLGNQAALAATGAAKLIVNFQNIRNKSEIITKEVALGDYEFEKLNKGTEAMSTAAMEKNKDQPATVRQYIWDPSTEENQDLMIDKVCALPVYVSQFLSVINHVTIYGDSEITAGDVITVHIDEPSGTTHAGQNEESSTISGNFLVAKVRHCLTFGDTPEYYQALEIIKDGMNSQTEPVKMSAMIK